MTYFATRPEDKLPALLYLMRCPTVKDRMTIVFTATRHHVEYLTLLLASAGIKNVGVYGNMDMTARKANIAKVN